MRLRLALALPALALLTACGGGSASDALREESSPSPRDTASAEETSSPEPEPEDSGGVDEAETIDAIDTLEPGTCLEEPEEGEFDELRVVPCAEAHNAEAYFAFDASSPDGEFPGEDALEDQAEEACLREFDAYVGLAYEESELYAGWIYPTEESWAFGDMAMVCYLVTEDSAPTLTGSARGSAR